MKKCPQCGIEYTSGTKFCPNDGTSLREPITFYDGFISYRREGGSETAALIRVLVETGHNKNLFLDVDELRTGRFDERLLTIIENSANFILVLSSGSLDHCNEPEDWLRREIVAALEHKKNIIPVLTAGFRFPPASSLPKELRDLPNFHGVVYNHQYRDAAISKIVQFMASQQDRKFDHPSTLNAPKGRQSGGTAVVAPVLTSSSVSWSSGNVPVIGKSWTVPGLGLEMVWIQPGSFVMGSPEGETGRCWNEKQHRVTLTKGYWLGKYPVTQRQWQDLMGHNPSHFVTGKVLKKEGFFTSAVFMSDSSNCPVESISWEDAVAFCERLSKKEGRHYRLPTEAEQEYACRAGTIGPYAGTGDPESMGWHYGGTGTHPVGQKKANAWGLYDMHGNVAEWCSDWYDDYPDSDQVDPTGPISGRQYIWLDGKWLNVHTTGQRVVRGGSWRSYPQDCRSAARFASEHAHDFIGFRIVLDSN